MRIVNDVNHINSKNVSDFRIKQLILFETFSLTTYFLANKRKII